LRPPSVFHQEVVDFELRSLFLKFNKLFLAFTPDDNFRTSHGIPAL
jgi:hypothetical protein